VNEIKQIGFPTLRIKSENVTKITDKEKRIVINLWKLLDKSRTGVGLSAPQIGSNKRIIIAKDNDRKITLINPVIHEVEKEKEKGFEGCLSVPNINVEIERLKKIKVTGKNLGNNEVSLELEGLLARIVQHEVDHLDGKVIIYYLPEERRKNILEIFSLKSDSIEWNILKAKSLNLIS